jgi:hypothetical protein
MAGLRGLRILSLMPAVEVGTPGDFRGSAPTRPALEREAT